MQQAGPLHSNHNPRVPTRLFAFCSSSRSGANSTAGASASSQSVVGGASRVVAGWASRQARMRAMRAATAEFEAVGWRGS